MIPLASSGFAARQSQQPPSASHMSSKMSSGAASAVYRTQNANQPGAAAGLANPTGANHCFLNVLVQTLCHLPDFQQPLKAMGEAESSGSSSPSLIRALKALFSAMQGTSTSRCYECYESSTLYDTSYRQPWQRARLQPKAHTHSLTPHPPLILLGNMVCIVCLLY